MTQNSSDENPPPPPTPNLLAIVLGRSNPLPDDPIPQEPKFSRPLENFTNRAFATIGNFVGRFSPKAASAVRNVGTGTLRIEHSVATLIGNFNADRAIACLDANATSYSRGKCAAYVRKAIEAGGVDLYGHPIAAADYKGFMDKKGFKVVAEGHGLNIGKYVSREGDICVWTRTPGHESGHIAMYNGEKWKSDFVQRDMAGGNAFRTSGHFTVYRYTGDMDLASGGKPAPAKMQGANSKAGTTSSSAHHNPSAPTLS